MCYCLRCGPSYYHFVFVDSAGDNDIYSAGPYFLVNVDGDILTLLVILMMPRFVMLFCICW